jgi:acylpyruvate hydrolase
MKLVTFKIHKEERIGAYVGDQIVDLNAAYALYLKEVEREASARRLASVVIPSCMKEFLEGGDKSFSAAKKAIEFASKKGEAAVDLDGDRIFWSKDQVHLCAPVPKPGKIYCMAINFYDHGTEEIKDPEKRKAEIERWKSLKLDIPVLFNKGTSLVCGPADPIIKPRHSEKLDYECELAVVIGKKCKYISKEEAYNYIAGYTIMNDVTVKDQGFPNIDWVRYQKGVNWTKAKGMDNAAPMGPCLVTRDEIPDPYSPPLKIITRVNGQLRQNGDLSTMIIQIPRIVEYIADGTTLEPGDVISAGTVAGDGAVWGSFLKVGDTIECEIPQIGVLKQKIVAD